MSKPISIKTLNELFDHNYWARDRQLQVCATLTEEQFKQSLDSSFSSLWETLVHMMAVEWLWLERWRRKTPQSLLSPVEFPSLTAIQNRWHVVEKEMKEYLAGINEENIEQLVTCVSTRGQTWTYPLWRMMLHLLNHQSYHRGQVTTLLRQQGIEPAKVDFLDAYDARFRI
jgi:uncharacterized damage-inducible protein DinB